MTLQPLALLLGLTLGSACLADTTPFDLSAGDLSQNWSNAALITANDDWSGVPSIQGYRGDGLTGSTGADPQTLLAADDPGVVDVVANQVNPDTVTAGGVLEFDAIANPAVALNGSGTADAPYLRLHLNTTGRQDIQVSYNLRDLDGSADNSTQQYALHYRVGNSGGWTNVPAGYVADASGGPSTATQVTAVSVMLPAAVNDQAEVQVRIMTSNAAGNDEAVGVDDIVVSSAPMGVMAAVLVTPIAGLGTTEVGSMATFDVVLATAPIADVTIGLSSNDVTELSVGTGSLIFTPANWNMPQSVTVTGVDDGVADGNVMSTIDVAAAVSADPAYDGVDGPDVMITNFDDESPNILISPNQAVVTEAGATNVMISVQATTPPVDDVIVSFVPTNPAEIAVTPSVVLPSGSTAVQMITISAVDDGVLDGDIDSMITVTASSAGDAVYDSINPIDILATTLDNEGAAVLVSPTAGLVTTEAGGTDTFDVVLGAMPSADVSIGVSSDNVAEGTTNVASLVFTAANWDIPQTVTVTGVDDDIDDGDQAYQILLAAATSMDSAFNGIDPDDVMVSNLDDDTAGISVTPTIGLLTSEAGGSDNFSVVLNTQPTADVSVGISSSDPSEGTVNVANLTFTSANWDTPQTVTVTGVDDDIDDGDLAYLIVTAAAASADGQYNGLDPADVGVVNTDDDNAGISVTPTVGLVTSEAGASDSFVVVLNSEPTASVSVGISSSDPSEGTVSVASLNFTNANWDTPQTVTVTGVDDAAVDGDVAYTILTAAATSADTAYNGIDPADVAVSNQDDDSAGLSINDVSVTEGTGGNTTATFSVTLDVAVAGGFSVDFATANGSATAPADYASNSGSLNFVGNAGEMQTIDVSIVTDSSAEPDENYTVDLSNPSNPAVLLADATGTGTIVDDDGTDLAITLNAPASVVAGEQLVYTAMVTNNGPGEATGASVSFDLATGTSFVSGTVGGGGSCSGADPVLCSFDGVIASGANRSASITVAVAPAALTPLSVNATVSSVTVDPTAANNSAMATTTVQTSADLVYSLDVVPQDGVVGDFFDLLATSRNDGPSDAQSVTIDVNVPAGMLIINRTPSAGGTCAELPVTGGTTLSCTWAGATAPGISRSVTALVQAVANGQLEVGGSTSSDTPDPAAGNNASGVIVAAGVQAIPTLQPWWLLLLGLSLAGLGALTLRPRA